VLWGHSNRLIRIDSDIIIVIVIVIIIIIIMSADRP
jgi:hypothetical protein